LAPPGGRRGDRATRPSGRVGPSLGMPGCCSLPPACWGPATRCRVRLRLLALSRGRGGTRWRPGRCSRRRGGAGPCRGPSLDCRALQVEQRPYRDLAIPIFRNHQIPNRSQSKQRRANNQPFLPTEPEQRRAAGKPQASLTLFALHCNVRRSVNRNSPPGLMPNLSSLSFRSGRTGL
jgi:hypothetical protein